jgi:tetratricopeptide (TPR) repeat protein
MKQAFKAAICAAALIVLGTGPGFAASTVYGSGDGPLCFEAAKDGRGDLTALNTCDAALQDPLLSGRDRAATLVNRGVVKLHRRDAASARSDFDAAIAARPDLGEAYVNRGAALIRMGDYRAAIASIDEGLQKGAEDPHEAYFNRAIALELLGDLVGAYRDYRKAQSLKPGWPLPAQELARYSVAPR